MPNRPNLQRFLDRLTIRSILTEEEQEAVLSLPGQAEQVHGNQDFVRLGERVDHSCLIVAGIVGRFDQNGEGIRQITAMHIPGDMCDLHSVVQPTPTSALQALSVSTILRIPHTAIRSAAAEYPAVAEALWRDCMVDASILCEWVVNVGRRDAKMRVAHLLCEMASRLGAMVEGLDDIVFDLPVTQTQVADATALTPVHVNRTLQSLRAERLVDWHQRVVRLPRLKALMRLAEFDSDYLQSDVKPEERLRIVNGERSGKPRRTN
ncbi:MAG: Crp/Fnr family transcriptional regulator [Sphingomonas sp.]|nr:Crp/Fnr family transcriptional regulator [Sphingomonas sp.]